jgi:hypothetical protein
MPNPLGMCTQPTLQPLYPPGELEGGCAQSCATPSLLCELRLGMAVNIDCPYGETAVVKHCLATHNHGRLSLCDLRRWLTTPVPCKRFRIAWITPRFDVN